ncbi:MAG: hypothetical protein RIM99_19065 [Cyclobacteriaceae bacterium]
MKLRIRGNSIRLRLTQTEVQNLKEQQVVGDSCEFPGGDSLGYRLKAGMDFSVDLNGNKIDISVPQEIIHSWTESEDLSIEEELELRDGNHLRLLIEKDLQCLTIRSGEDESDAFPNPKEQC